MVSHVLTWLKKFRDFLKGKSNHSIIGLNFEPFNSKIKVSSRGVLR